MANWIRCDEADFRAHLDEIRASHEVYTEFIQKDRVRIYWTGGPRYNSPEADWIAKVEVAQKTSYYYITEQ